MERLRRFFFNRSKALSSWEWNFFNCRKRLWNELLMRLVLLSCLKSLVKRFNKERCFLSIPCNVLGTSVRLTSVRLPFFPLRIFGIFNPLNKRRIRPTVRRMLLLNRLRFLLDSLRRFLSFRKVRILFLLFRILFAFRISLLRCRRLSFRRRFRSAFNWRSNFANRIRTFGEKRLRTFRSAAVSPL